MGVRLATINDVKAVSYVHAKTWKYAYVKYIPLEYLNNIADDGWVPIFTKELANNIRDIAVYELDGSITGAVTYEIQHYIEDSNDISEGEIISLYVLPEYWSKKQGYELTKFAINDLKSQGAKSCYLWVIKQNERAINFYKKFGFVSTNEINNITYAGQSVTMEKYRICL